MITNDFFRMSSIFDNKKPTMIPTGVQLTENR